MDEYKQLKESLNRVPNLKEPEQNPVPQQPQAAAIAPGSRVYVAQNEEPSSTDPPHKVEPAHEDHLDSQSRVTVFFCFNIYMYVCMYVCFLLDLTVFFSVGPPSGGGECPCPSH